ncbi:MAG: hypothetical protein IJ815_07220, partial [Lachnospiraceae bacterium]|nr:hypothetical protein [Lachnospiraceae bacterium]
RNKVLGEGSITIKNDHLKVWEISKEELWENVYESCNEVAKMTSKSMLSIFGDNSNLPFGSEALDDMIVLSTEGGMYGAASFMYPGVLKTLSDSIGGGNLVIIPSSVHEVILAPMDKLIMEREDLLMIVNEVNTSVVQDEDVLSDNLYKYDSEHDEISIWD